MWFKRSTEVTVGLFLLAGILAMLMLALRVSGLTEFTHSKGYDLTASFDNIGGLRVNAPVTLAGVKIGSVQSIHLNSESFKADVTMDINPKDNNLPADSSASILTAGLLGSNYIGLTPGFDDSVLKNGGRIEETHSALILENLIGQLLFSLKNDDEKSEEKPNATNS